MHATCLSCLTLTAARCLTRDQQIKHVHHGHQQGTLPTPAHPLLFPSEGEGLARPQAR